MLSANLDGLTLRLPGRLALRLCQAGEFGDPADQLRIFDFHIDFNTPASLTFTERTGSPLGGGRI